jgi:hypothetical protein
METRKAKRLTNHYSAHDHRLLVCRNSLVDLLKIERLKGSAYS